MNRKVTLRGLLGVFGGFVAGWAILGSLDYGADPSVIGFAILWIFALVYLDHIETNTQRVRELLEQIANRTE